MVGVVGFLKKVIRAIPPFFTDTTCGLGCFALLEVPPITVSVSPIIVFAMCTTRKKEWAVEWTAVGARRAEIRVLLTASITGDTDMKEEASSVLKVAGTCQEQLVALTASGLAIVEVSGTKKESGDKYMFIKKVKIDEVTATMLMIYVIGTAKNFKTGAMDDCVIQVPLNHVNAGKLLELVVV